VSHRDKILAYLTEPRTIKEIAEHVDGNYHAVKNFLVAMKMRDEVHAFKDTQNRLMHYYIPQPHPLQSIFKHTANFTDEQIKGIIIHTADDAKHNLQHKTTQETYGESVAYTLTRYD
jgi:alpha-acetolactate decarboxylase